MAEVTKVPVVPVVAVRVHSVAHIFRVPGGSSPLATGNGQILSPDTRSTGLAEVLCRCSHRVATIVSHSLVRDQPIPGKAGICHALKDKNWALHGNDPARSLTQARVTAVPPLEVDQLARVVSDLHHRHGVVVGDP